ncbi:MAG TPA: hypothetical protein PK668_15865 [Myxococcota bacterium]|nr:hypothetical protein [Myxococcota bacterium]HRY94373.1 hypothetical protein [Myxococcota bacterium]HSA23459.1 hypothetical protein [Myxococcota bacterium]
MRARTGGWLALLGLCLVGPGGCASEGGAGEACRGGSSPCDQGLFCQGDLCQRGDLLGDRSVLKTEEIDLLFVIDNSGSMVGEQIQLAESFGNLTAILDDRFGVGKYQVGVITTGMESPGCPPCDQMITQSCTNPSGENGRLQDRRGRISDSTTDPPTFLFEPPEPSCRVVDSGDQTCFYDPAGGGLYGSGTAFVGTNGCGYEKGLEPIRVALSDLANTVNEGFLREDATLAVVVVSDEDDCGAVGDVTEGVSGIGGRVCYYAARGEGPDGSTEDPQAHRPYALTPVQEYHDFLMGLKGNRQGMVKFVAVVGVTDPDDPSATEIEYTFTAPNADVLPACITPGCTGPSCQAFPGTRYIELAELFGLGEDGLVGTICQDDFSSLMALIGESVSCPSTYALGTPVASPAGLVVAVDGRALPRYSCAAAEALTACSGPEDTSCGAAACAETWQYLAPTGEAWAPGGYVAFAAHADPCRSRPAGAFKVSVFQPAP